MVTGIYLGIWKNMLLLLMSLVMAGVFAIFCLVLRMRDKNDRIALAPFVLAHRIMLTPKGKSVVESKEEAIKKLVEEIEFTV